MSLLVTGAGGNLGAYIVRELARRDSPFVAWTNSQFLDLTNEFTVVDAFLAARPTHVIHAAALATVSDCHRDPARAAAVNLVATARLADLAHRQGARFVYVSTDLVFDGESAPYGEGAVPNPLSEYGRTKAAAELAVCTFPNHAIVRLSLLYGPSLVGRPTFFDATVAALRAGQPVKLFHDEWRTPLDLATAASALIDITQSTETGVFHVGGPERMSRLEMGQRIAATLGLDARSIVAASRLDEAPELRPRDTTLDSSRWRSLFPTGDWPTIERGMERSD